MRELRTRENEGRRRRETTKQQRQPKLPNDSPAHPGGHEPWRFQIGFQDAQTATGRQGGSKPNASLSKANVGLLDQWGLGPRPWLMPGAPWDNNRRERAIKRRAGTEETLRAAKRCRARKGRGIGS